MSIGSTSVSLPYGVLLCILDFLFVVQSTWEPTRPWHKYGIWCRAILRPCGVYPCTYVLRTNDVNQFPHIHIGIRRPPCSPRTHTKRRQKAGAGGNDRKNLPWWSRGTSGEQLFDQTMNGEWIDMMCYNASSVRSRLSAITLVRLKKHRILCVCVLYMSSKPCLDNPSQPWERSMLLRIAMRTYIHSTSGVVLYVPWPPCVRSAS